MNPLTKEAEPFVHIDELQLDKECIRLPSDYLKFAHAAAEAKQESELADARMKETDANLASVIRDNPGKYGIEKITEAAITAAVAINPAHLHRQTESIAARHQFELAQAIVWALEHKKRSLTLLVELHGLGWFANPKISEAGRAAVNDMTKAAARRPADRDDVTGRRNRDR